MNPSAFTVNWPGRLAFGAGKLEVLKTEAPALGSRALLVTTAELTADVFAYMGRPVQQHLPVFTRDEMWQLYDEALFRTGGSHV